MSMNWNDHHELEGKHAFLGASQNSWLGWNEEKVIERWLNQFSQAIGTALHELAKDCIKAHIKVNKTDIHLIEMQMAKALIPKKAYKASYYINSFSAYVTDAICFKMDPEVILKYSRNCYGTADTISYDEKTKTLRIHDYKSGTKEVANFNQLLVYAALFYLEYKLKPSQHTTILRLYQETVDENGEPNGPYREAIARPEEIETVMMAIENDDRLIEEFRRGTL